MIDPGIAGRIALVTGIDNPRGIGVAIAGALAAQGADLCVTYRAESVSTAPAEDYEHSLAALRAFGGRLLAVPVDLADPASIPTLFDRAETELGTVEILVNNAAFSEPNRFAARPGGSDIAHRDVQELTTENHDRHFAVISRAPALAMVEFARRHTRAGHRWGRVINISTDGADGFAGEISYGASKAALESYSRAAAVELGPYGITVNIISPGPIQTGWLPPEAEPQVARNIPLGRVGHPDDVADVVVFLASEQARWVTGQRIFVGGGHRM